MFEVEDIIELKQNIFMYNKGTICQVMKIDEDNTNYGWVKILKYPNGTMDNSKEKRANLTLFKLVRRNGFYV